MKNVLGASNLNKIVPSSVIVLVVLFSFSALIVSQPFAHAYDDEGSPKFPPPFSMIRNFSSPVTVSRGVSVTLWATIFSGANNTAEVILTLEESFMNTPKYLSWESQYVKIPPYGSAYTNITVRVTEDAPLGGFPHVYLTLKAVGYGSITYGGFGLRVVEDNNWGLVTWFEVAGSQPKVTKNFTCSHSEWRVLWRYIPKSGSTPMPPPPPFSRSDWGILSQYAARLLDAEATSFDLSVYRQGEESEPIASIVKTGSEETDGVIYVHESGTFYLKITAANIGGYTVVVEEESVSIPEFPSWASLVLVFAISMVIVQVCQRKLASAKNRNVKNRNSVFPINNISI